MADLLNVLCICLVIEASVWLPGASGQVQSNSHTVELTRRDSCSDNSAYNSLHRLISHDSCLGADAVFTKLRGLADSCQRQIIRLLAEQFPAGTKSPGHCDCAGAYSLMHYHSGRGDGIIGDYHFQCHSSDAAYKKVYDSFFDNFSHDYTQACRTHHSLWSDLSNMRTQDHVSRHPCQMDLIKHLEWSFKQHPDPCTCTEGTTTKSTTTTTTTTPPPTTVTTTTPTTTSTTTRPTTTTTTTPVPTTTVAIVSSFQCDKSAAVVDLASGIPVRHPNSSVCDPLFRGSDDAFILNVCNSPSSNSWVRGAQVAGNCDRIPLYTPLATFTSGTYTAQGGISGLFAGCVPDGFKILLQPCGQPPMIDYIVTGGVYAHDPNNFYILM